MVTDKLFFRSRTDWNEHSGLDNLPSIKLVSTYVKLGDPNTKDKIEIIPSVVRDGMGFPESSELGIRDTPNTRDWKLEDWA